jgi:hypothetical protein
MLPPTSRHIQQRQRNQLLRMLILSSHTSSLSSRLIEKRFFLFFPSSLSSYSLQILKDLDANIPRSQFSSRNSRFGDQPTCMICLDPIIDGDEIRNLKCSHCFHSKCVDIWLLGTLSDESLNTSICPTCRQEAISADYVSVASSEESPSSQQSQSTNSQVILSPRPIYLPPAQDHPSSSNQNLSSNSSYSESTESNTGFLPQDSDIPREIFMRVGQYLLDEATMDTPSPLMSPAPIPLSPGMLSNASERIAVAPQGIPDIQIRSRTSSFSSVSSSQSVHSSTSSSVSSFLSIPNSIHSGSGVHINFSVLGNSFDILSIASGE